MSDYVPIDCGIHDQLELAIMHRALLRISWQDSAGKERSDKFVPTDTVTHDGAEYLIYSEGEIRLDMIHSFEEISL